MSADSGEPSAPTPPARPRTWADRISIPLLLATCFAAGGAWAQLASLSTKLDAIATEQRADHDRLTRLEVVAQLRQSGP